MEPDTFLPVATIRNDLSEKLQKDAEILRSSTIELNKASDRYRSTLSLIDEKIIYLAAGTISLFLTFLGILFNSRKDVTSLHYPLIFLSIFGFLATIVLLLTARWQWSRYVFSASHRHYLENLKGKHETELQFLRTGGKIIDSTTYSPMSEEDIEASAGKIETYIEKIEKQIKVDEGKERKQSGWAKNLAVLAYAAMILGYVLATLFFIGLAGIMSGVA